MKDAYAIGVAFFGLIAAACGAGQAIDGVVYLPTTKPAETNLVGSWHIRPSQIANAKEWYGFDCRDAEIVLAADHTIAWRRVPDVFLDNFWHKDPKLADGQGTWQLKLDPDVWRLRVASDGPKAGGFESSITLWNRSKPYSLALDADDPDECHSVFFDREPDAKSK